VESLTTPEKLSGHSIAIGAMTGHVLRGGTSKLRCGTGGKDGWGYRHIFSEHRTEWEKDAFLTGKDWRTHTDWVIDLVLDDPDKVSYKADNNFHLLPADRAGHHQGKVLGHSYPNVVVAADGKNIISAYPPKKHC
jgi:hypothetical protein